MTRRTEAGDHSQLRGGDNRSDADGRSMDRSVGSVGSVGSDADRTISPARTSPQQAGGVTHGAASPQPQQPDASLLGAALSQHQQQHVAEVQIRVRPFRHHAFLKHYCWYSLIPMNTNDQYTQHIRICRMMMTRIKVSFGARSMINVINDTNN